ncbi:DinB family protein [Cellulophaga baltica]|uniref:DinB family protein n=1 Tax=Cellulophaga TaxID=104264 RepID=UPI001C072902|nr:MULTISPECIES: DinB family protein [Cellulophaga]MBU2995705.1 DinB family protein [Cellulophaga baltica]MDO6767099.1 DinB family protein [Cellulophaga sp. 1_MG-2023]
MEKLFDIILKNRKILYKFLTSTPREQLLNIPEGYRNNIWWNIAHVVVTQELLVNKFSGLPLRISNEMVEKYKKGTVPDGLATEDEIELVEGLLFSTLELMQQDYEQGKYKTYTEYTTSVNITLSSVEDAIAFNAYHEGLHTGAILSLLKVQTK